MKLYSNLLEFQMVNSKIIQVIVNILLKEPTEAYKVSNKLLGLGFPSEQISLTLDALIEDDQIKVDENWKLYLNPPLE